MIGASESRKKELNKANSNQTPSDTSRVVQSKNNMNTSNASMAVSNEKSRAQNVFGFQAKSINPVQTAANNNSNGFYISTLLASKFLLTDKVGQGSFGCIFRAINQETQATVAVKVERRNNLKISMLSREAQILLDLQNEVGFPDIFYFGKENEASYMVMSYLGPNLEYVLRKSGQSLSMKSVIMAGVQMVKRIESLHSKNYLHRDIKPENFCIGSGDDNKTIYLIDFGLAKVYQDEQKNHIPYKDKKGMVGTARYASLNTHLGIEQSRRDDLEGIGYVLIYLAHGTLPWQNLVAETKEEKYKKIFEVKKTIPTEKLCEGLPSEFCSYFNYVKSMEFEEEPDYEYLTMLFENMLDTYKYENDCEFDWLEIFQSKDDRSSTDADKREDSKKKTTDMKSKDQPLASFNHFIKLRTTERESKRSLFGGKSVMMSCGSSKIPHRSMCDVEEEEPFLTIQKAYTTREPEILKKGLLFSYNDLMKLKANKKKEPNIGPGNKPVHTKNIKTDENREPENLVEDEEENSKEKSITEFQNSSKTIVVN